MRSLLALAAAAAAVTAAASPAATSLGSSDFQTAVLGRPELWIVDFYAPVRAIPLGVCCCRTTPLLLARRQRQPDPQAPRAPGVATPSAVVRSLPGAGAQL